MTPLISSPPRCTPTMLETLTLTSAILIGLESRPTGTGVRARVIHTQLGGITRGGGHTLIDVVLTQSARPALPTHTTAHWVTGGRAHPTVTGGGAIRPPGIGHCTAYQSKQGTR